MNPLAKNIVTLSRAVLNPNAAEFVPSALKSSSSSAIAGDSSSSSAACAKVVNKEFTGENGGKAVLNRADSTNSNASDDECRQYWRSQLPDDITPDFDFLGHSPDDRFVSEESVSQASLLDHNTTSTVVSKVTVNGTRNGNTELVFHDGRQQIASQGTSYSLSTGDSKFGHSAWEHQSMLSGNRDRQLTASNGNDIDNLSELSGDRFFSDDSGEIDPVDLLVNEFPGFAAQSLADIYHANGGDLSLTIEMLTQLELQEEGGPPRHLQSQPSSPNLNMTEFPSLLRPELDCGLPQSHGDVDVQQSATARRAVDFDALFPTRSSSAVNSRAVTDFAAVVRKNTGHSTAQWQYERNGGVDMSVGLSRASSQNLGLGSLPGNSRIAHGERLGQISQPRRSPQLPQIWLETGDAVANIYSELREEARDHARIRNAFFEQARQAYLVGNKALAKELSVKGQWHNSLMKAAHNKAGEAIFRQRNLSGVQVQSSAQGQPRLLDLHGLHVNEAIPLLKREVASLRMAARSTQQRQHVFVCVGTGHHTKGSRTPARLPVAVERYLAEEEHVNFTEPQPGMLWVVLG